MDVEIAEKVSKLLTEKANYTNDLSRLISKDYSFHLSVDTSYSMIVGAFPLHISKNKEFNDKLKELIIHKLKEEVKRIDEEISQLEC